MSNEKKPKWRILTWGKAEDGLWTHLTLMDYDPKPDTFLNKASPLFVMEVNSNFGRRDLMEYAELIRDALNTKEMIE